MAHMLNWFEIPVRDIHRACTFYGAIFNADIQPTEFAGFTMAYLPGQDGDVTGGLIQHEMYTPSHHAGPLLYLNGGDDLQAVLDRVEGAGGQILSPKREIAPEVGYMALFIDSEGNRMALHSMG
ncbi:MAG: VOC family protein [Bacteroidia bacterium]|nr:VOC family protein [Bacteroidia bacterium]